MEFQVKCKGIEFGPQNGTEQGAPITWQEYSRNMLTVVLLFLSYSCSILGAPYLVSPLHSRFSAHPSIEIAFLVPGRAARKESCPCDLWFGVPK